MEEAPAVLDGANDARWTDALAALARGEVDFAIVTDEPLRNARSASGFEAIPLGALAMQVEAGPTHPLAPTAGATTSCRAVSATGSTTCRCF